MDFNERKEIGDVGELIIYTALIQQIIPNCGEVEKIKIEKGIGVHGLSIAYNAKNGDLKFLDKYGNKASVDVKSGDEIALKSMRAFLDESGEKWDKYYFLNALTFEKIGFSFMFKFTREIFEWIIVNMKSTTSKFSGDTMYRITRIELETAFPDCNYPINDKAFYDHKMKCRIFEGLNTLHSNEEKVKIENWQNLFDVEPIPSPIIQNAFNEKQKQSSSI